MASTETVNTERNSKPIINSSFIIWLTRASLRNSIGKQEPSREQSTLPALAFSGRETAVKPTQDMLGARVAHTGLLSRSRTYPTEDNTAVPTGPKRQRENAAYGHKHSRGVRRTAR